MKNNNKLWAGLSNQQINPLLEKFNNSFSFDFALWKYDIQGSLAHATMLRDCQIISEEDYLAISQGLNDIHTEIESNPNQWKQHNLDAEDIHSAIEQNLIAKIGEAGKKLHTARSRNDQVATDLRLYLRDETHNTLNHLRTLCQTLVSLASRDKDQYIPGYTHLQQAQPISLGHYWLAHYERFNRDIGRLSDSLERLNINPLGSGALAGTTININRQITTDILKFDARSNNSLDAVSDRDFVAEYQFCASLIIIHLSQMAEEMIIWASQEFGFIRISDEYSTGSSMMPQKRNPDIPELIRGKTGRILGHLQAILTTLKGLPLAYNKDLQEDKEGLFDTVTNINISLNIMNDFIQAITFQEDHLKATITDSFMNATDLADYLTKKNVPFRSAYQLVGQIVNHCIENNIYLKDISLSTWKDFHELFEEDIYDHISPTVCVNKRISHGGTSPKEVSRQIDSINSRGF